MATSFIDPVAQTFFIDAANYPKGMFVHSVDLVFKKKDEVTFQPFTIQLRPTVNGYPHSSIIHSSAALGQVALRPDKINTISGVGSNIPDINNPNHYTRFKFPAPVFLLPGEHAIVMFTNSDNYEIFIAEIGGTRLDGSDRRVDKQVYTGSFFKSQNGSTYTAYQDIDLMFKLNACDFSTDGSTELVLQNIPPSSNTEFDLMKVATQELVFDGATTNYLHKLTDNSSGILATEYTEFLQDENIILDVRKVAYNSGNSAFIKVGLRTTDNTVSPMIDASRVNLIGIKNIINDCGLESSNFTITNSGTGYTANAVITITGNKGSGAVATAVANTTTGQIDRIEVTSSGSGYTENVSCTVAAPSVPSGNITATVICASETNSKGGPALARYITRKVNLADGFDANMVRVYITAYQPSQTTVEVYYKILADEDETLFDDRPYVKMQSVQPGNESLSNILKSQVETDFLEYLYIPTTTDCSYVGTDGITYSNFKTFAIKIVMRTSDTNYIPIIKDFRAIALAP
jgi:hypothetical protein